MSIIKYKNAAAGFFKKRASGKSENDDGEMSFLDHLEELRGTLIKCLIALGVTFTLSIIGFSYVNKALMYPLNAAKHILVSYNKLTGSDLESKIPARAEKIGPFYLEKRSPEGKSVREGPFFMVSEEGQKEKGSTTLTLLKSGSTGEAALVSGNWYANIQLRSMSFQTPIVIWFSVGFLGGFALALPFILYFIAQFVAPGLLPEERRLMKPIILASILLFFTGVAFAFFIMLPFGIAFLSNMSHQLGIEMFPDAQSYYMMVIFLTFAVGLTFELPLLLIALIYLGVLNPETLKKNRRMVFLVILIFATVVTPPDCITQILLTVPLYLFYEVALAIGSRLRTKKLAKEEEEEKIAEMEDAKERAEYVEMEAKRRLAQRENDDEDPYNSTSGEDQPYDDYDPNVDEIDDYDYGEDEDFDFDEESYVDYEEAERLNKAFSPDWELNEPDLSFFAPKFEKYENSGEKEGNPSKKTEA